MARPISGHTWDGSHSVVAGDRPREGGPDVIIHGFRSKAPVIGS